MAIAVGLIVGLFILFGMILLRTGFRNPRGLIIAICGIAALYWYGERQLQQDIQDVGLTAGRSTDCTGDQLQVVIANGRTEDIIGFSFTLHGFRQNFSDHIAYESHSTDRIVPAGRSWASCWDVEDLLELPIDQKSALRWEVAFTGIDYAE